MKTKIQILGNDMLRKFGLVTGGIIVGLFGLLLPCLLESKYPLWPWGITIVLWCCAMFYPRSLSPMYKGWMATGNVLGWINTRIILGLVFYIVIMPIGLVMRLLGKDPMNRKLSYKETSYRVQSKKPDRQQIERPF